MKAIEALKDELPNIFADAEKQIVAAQRTKLVGILVKALEERDTLVATIEKNKKAYEEQLKKNEKSLEDANKKIEQIKTGNWDVIKEDGKGQGQPQGGGDNKPKDGGKPEGGGKPE
jgi:hypothetical protein